MEKGEDGLRRRPWSSNAFVRAGDHNIRLIIYSETGDEAETNRLLSHGGLRQRYHKTSEMDLASPGVLGYPLVP